MYIYVQIEKRYSGSGQMGFREVDDLFAIFCYCDIRSETLLSCLVLPGGLAAALHTGNER